MPFAPKFATRNFARVNLGKQGIKSYCRHSGRRFKAFEDKLPLSPDTNFFAPLMILLYGAQPGCSFVLWGDSRGPEPVEDGFTNSLFIPYNKRVLEIGGGRLIVGIAVTVNRGLLTEVSAAVAVVSDSDHSSLLTGIRNGVNVRINIADVEQVVCGTVTTSPDWASPSALRYID